ncbi:MAG TPA: hypothetical protein PKL54_03970, partial [Candidatus Hydrogenedentes bacterium]|nr:hypothetical protein [Candidatus Hydrogenedentota bacterium]
MLAFIAALGIGCLVHGAAPTPGEMATAAEWAAAKFAGESAPGFDGAPFFSFTYGGKASADLLPSWTVTRAVEAPDAHRARHTVTWTDPETGLEVRCEGVRYLDFPTVEWTLHFRNTGAADTPLLE